MLLSKEFPEIFASVRLNEAKFKTKKEDMYYKSKGNCAGNTSLTTYAKNLML